MELVKLTLTSVIAIHDHVIQPEELQGFAVDKSLEARLMRIENRLHYGLVNDPFELVALYAVCIAIGHCFNDASIRTAANVLTICLKLNGIEPIFNPIEFAEKIREVAQERTDEKRLSKWLLMSHLNKPSL